MVDHVHAHPLRAFDSNGDPAAGATLDFRLSGTNTAVDVYADVNVGSILSQPVASGQNGAAPGVFPAIFSTGQSLKAICKDADGVELWTMDPVPTMSISSSSATDITVTPFTNFPQSNVQAALDALRTLWNAVTTYGRSLIASADASAARTVLGLGGLATLDVIDEDNMASDSATRPPSQQSTKAYVIDRVATSNGSQAGTAPVYGARAWGFFSDATGTSATLVSSGNIASVTYGGSLGRYDVLFTTAMPDANYAVVGSYATSAGDTASDNDGELKFYGATTAGFSIAVINGGGTHVAPTTRCNFAVYR